MRCYVVLLSFPNESLASLSEKVRAGGSKNEFKKAIDALDQLSVEPLPAVKPASVDKVQRQGYSVKSCYKIFSPKEFVAHFMVDHTKISTTKGQPKIFLTQIVNECDQEEEVILVRDGPRLLEVSNFVGLRMTETVMDRQIRADQASSTYEWAQRNTRSEDMQWHSAQNARRHPTMPYIDQVVAGHVKNLENAEAVEDRIVKQCQHCVCMSPQEATRLTLNLGRPQFLPHSEITQLAPILGSTRPAPGPEESPSEPVSAEHGHTLAQPARTYDVSMLASIGPKHPSIGWPLGKPRSAMAQIRPPPHPTIS